MAVRKAMVGGILAIVVSSSFITTATEERTWNPGNPETGELVEGGCGEDCEATLRRQVPKNPYGCYGRSDNPHKSRYDPRDITGKSTTACSVPVPVIKADNYLWVKRWWGWRAIGRPGTKELPNRKEVVAVAATDCKNGTYGVEGVHFALGSNGIAYGMTTLARSEVRNC
jgi:hypothetical protein